MIGLNIARLDSLPSLQPFSLLAVEKVRLIGYGCKLNNHNYIITDLVYILVVETS